MPLLRFVVQCNWSHCVERATFRSLVHMLDSGWRFKSGMLVGPYLCPAHAKYGWAELEDKIDCNVRIVSVGKSVG